MGGKTAVMQGKTIRELTRTARKAKAEMESYIEDLEMYSKPEFWEAVSEAESGKINAYRNIKEYAKKMGKK